MRGEELLRGMDGEPLQADELETIDEGMGLNNLHDMIVQNAEVNRRLGLGEDLPRASDRALIGPRTAEIMERMTPPRRKLPELKSRPKEKGIRGQAPGAPAIQTVRSIPVIPNELVISNFQVGNAQPYRVDLGIEGRSDILIANMSQSVIWVNCIATVSPTLGQFIGVPLKAMSGVNAFDGGVMRLRVQNNKRFWAQSVAGGFFLVVTIETAIRD